MYRGARPGDSGLTLIYLISQMSQKPSHNVFGAIAIACNILSLGPFAGYRKLTTYA